MIIAAVYFAAAAIMLGLSVRLLRRDAARSRELRALVVTRLGLDNPCAGDRHSPADMEVTTWSFDYVGIDCRACRSQFSIARSDSVAMTFEPTTTETKP